MLNIFFVKNFSSLRAWAKEVEKLLSVAKNVIVTGNIQQFYIIQIYTMAWISICNSVSIVIKIS